MQAFSFLIPWPLFIGVMERLLICRKRVISFSVILQTENILDRYLLCAGHGQAGWEHQKKAPVLSD